MTSIDRILTSIEAEPWSWLYRGAIGFALPALFRTVSPTSTSVLAGAAMFFGVLVALRAVPLVLRMALPFSAEVKAIWSSQRHLSKQFDSYAWQKLFWIGLGLLLFAAIFGGLRNSEVAVLLFCLICGGAGLWRWLAVRPVPSSLVAAPASS